MVRTLLFLGLWAALPASCEVGLAALYTEFENKPAPAVVQSLRDEVGFLMAPNGLRFEWRSLPESQQTTWADLAVVKFWGRCEVLPFAVNSQTDNRLAWTHVTDGAVLPFAEVDCEAVRAYLLRELSRIPQETRELVFGRALGRVVAHELLHIFAKSKAHSDHGVDHPGLKVAELLADHLEFAELEPAERIMHAASTADPGKGSGSPKAGQASFTRSGCASCHGNDRKGTAHGPTLRSLAGALNPITLVAKLAKSQDKMCRRAHSMKVASPSLGEDEISDLVRFLNGLE